VKHKRVGHDPVEEPISISSTETIQNGGIPKVEVEKPSPKKQSQRAQTDESLEVEGGLVAYGKVHHLSFYFRFC